MLQKIKKSILNFSNIKRTTVLVLLFSVCSGLIIPIYQSSAIEAPELSKWDFVLQSIFPPYMGLKLGLDSFGIVLTPKGFANAILESMFLAAVTISGIFLGIAKGFLNWVISPDFISVPFTNNPVVNLGWTTVRDFTNMLFILVLVVIALGSALRLKEYEVKKLLPVLIGIALLINFTPVICGFIIDASNIVMNTFLKGELLSEGFVKTLDTEISSLHEIKEPSDKLGVGMVLVAFNIVGTIIFLLFALLFAVRYIALWILVILSPIAFFCYILPQTKAVWSGWWKQFIQWCIIGIFAAFFMYLTNITIIEIIDKGGLISSPSLDSEIKGFSSIFMYIVPLAFLVIGFFVSLQTSAMGADKVIGFAQGAGKKATGFAKGKVKESAFVKGQTEKWRGRLERIPETVGTGRMKAEARAKHQTERDKAVEESQKLMEPMSVKDREKYAKTPTEKLAAFRLATKEDHLGEWDEKNIDIVKRYGTQKDLIDATKKRPDLAAKLNPEKVDEIMKKKPKMSREEAEREVILEKVQGMEPEELRKVQAETFKIPEEILKKQEEGQEFTKEEKIVIKTKLDIFHALDDRQLSEIGKKGKSKTKKAILETIVQQKGGLGGLLAEAKKLKDAGDTEGAKKITQKVAVLKGPGFRMELPEEPKKEQKGKQTKLS